MSDFERFEAMVTPEMIRAATEALGPCVGSCGEASPPDSYDIRCAIAAALAASPVPAGWRIRAHEDEDRSWIEIVGPGGQAAAFSAERGSVRAQVLQDYMAAAPTMLNGLTESETLATVSVAGLSAPAQQAEAKCDRCNGTGMVDDGEIDCYENGEPYPNGPVKCVKDCPACGGTGRKPVPAPAPAQQAEAQPFGWVVLSRDATWGAFFGAAGRDKAPSATDFDNAAPGMAPHRVVAVHTAAAPSVEAQAPEPPPMTFQEHQRAWIECKQIEDHHRASLIDRIEAVINARDEQWRAALKESQR